MNLQDWKQKGKFIEVNGHQLFYIDTEEKDKPVLLILHGYPSSSYDYHAVLTKFAKKFRVIVHDHLGFGFSDKPLNYSYTLVDQTSVILKFWDQLNIKSGHILAHDYGTSIATEILARVSEGYKKIKFNSVTLSNGSVHIELAQLRTIQKLLKNPTVGPLIAKLSTKRLFISNMQNIWFDKQKVNENELDDLWELLTMNNGKKVLSQITRYIDERYKNWDRWIGAWSSTRIPAHILWAKNDPVAVPAIAKALFTDNPNARLTMLDQLGHYPMLENPERWANGAMEFYDGDFFD
jgi:pimeloyl-ACP methyl ester carboxylesterase